MLKMVENPNDFNEGDLKKIINEKTDPKQVKVKEHPKFVQLEKLIDDAKNGKILNILIDLNSSIKRVIILVFLKGISAGGDDLVVDEPINQVVKCPITQMPIKEIARNTRCDHVYEKSAILQYIKSKPNRKYYEYFFLLLLKNILIQVCCFLFLIDARLLDAHQRFNYKKTIPLTR